jgi:hypothetical protein
MTAPHSARDIDDARAQSLGQLRQGFRSGVAEMLYDADIALRLDDGEIEKRRKQRGVAERQSRIAAGLD